MFCLASPYCSAGNVPTIAPCGAGLLAFPSLLSESPLPINRGRLVIAVRRHFCRFSTLPAMPVRRRFRQSLPPHSSPSIRFSWPAARCWMPSSLLARSLDRAATPGFWPIPVRSGTAARREPTGRIPDRNPARNRRVRRTLAAEAAPDSSPFTPNSSSRPGWALAEHDAPERLATGTPPIWSGGKDGPFGWSMCWRTCKEYAQGPNSSLPRCDDS